MKRFLLMVLLAVGVAFAQGLPDTYAAIMNDVPNSAQIDCAEYNEAMPEAAACYRASIGPGELRLRIDERVPLADAAFTSPWQDQDPGFLRGFMMAGEAHLALVFGKDTESLVVLLPAAAAGN